MKNFHKIIVPFAFALLVFSCKQNADDKFEDLSDPAIEKDVIYWQNVAREDPKVFAEKYIEPRLNWKWENTNNPNYPRKYFDEERNIWILTREGKDAVKECVDEMKNTPSSGALQYASDLANAAKSHALDQSDTGQTGHDGSDGSNTQKRIQKYAGQNKYCIFGENIQYGCHDGGDIIIQLLIDDGVKDRGHRKNILKDDKENPWQFTGVSFINKHGNPPAKGYGTVCVITYGGGSCKN